LPENKSDTIFEAAGEYYFYVQAISEGCSSKLARFLIVVHPSPVVDFETSIACEGGLSTFTNLSTFSDGNPDTDLSWNWLLDGATFSTNKNASTVLTPGPHWVMLQATSQHGCKDEKRVDFNVKAKPILIPKFVCE
jgi:hypothetical protein